MKDHVNLFGDSVYFDGLEIFPIKMKDYMLFMSTIDVLRLKKNRIPDIKVIRMTYLEFLFDYWFLQEDNEDYFKMLLIVFKLSLSEEQFKTIDFKKANNQIYMLYRHIDEIREGNDNSKLEIIDYSKFEELRKFILKINNIKDVNYEISEEVEKLLEKAKMDKMRMENPAGLKLTIEDMIDCYHVWGGFSYSDIKEEPLYKFMRNISRMVMIDNYNINKTAEMSGNVKFKKEIEHWLKHIEEADEYDGVRIPLDTFVKEFNDKVSTK